MRILHEPDLLSLCRAIAGQLCFPTVSADLGGSVERLQLWWGGEVVGLQDAPQALLQVGI